MGTRSSARILIVDDELPTLEVMRRLMTRLGYATITAADGDSALRLIGTVHPDLVLLDVNMPGIDGVEVCRRIKGDVTTRLIPVVLVTTLAASEDRVQGIDAGADDFVSKPPNLTELEARVVRHHHERPDGTGYPDGLKGDDIPLLARILSVVDVFDALTTDRPYKPALSKERAVEELRYEAARGWKSATLVEAFASWVAETKLTGAARPDRRRR